MLDPKWSFENDLGLILLYNYTFYSRYSKDWITNTEISLGFNNSVIKNWCNYIYIFLIDYGNVLYLYELHREKTYLRSSAWTRLQHSSYNATEYMARGFKIGIWKVEG